MLLSKTLQNKRLWAFLILFILCNGIWFGFFQPSINMELEGREEETTIHFFYDNKSNDYPFDDSHMAIKSYVGNNKSQLFNVKVPKENLNKLRIDFGTLPSKFEIKSFSITNSPFSEINFNSYEFTERFSYTNDISEYKVVDDKVNIITSGEDGHIYSLNLYKDATPTFRVISMLYEAIIILGVLVIIYFDKVAKRITPILKIVSRHISEVILHSKSRKEYLIGFLYVFLISSLLAIFIDIVLLRMIAKVSILLKLDTLSRYFSEAFNFLGRRAYFWFIHFFIIGILILMGKRKALRFRYAIALLYLVLIVVGKFTGSSLGFYDGMLQGNTPNYQKSTLLGIPQGVRGDEWATEKPYYFAQVMGDKDLPYLNDNLSFTGSDMVVSAFAPVKDIVILARPDLWGFLFLPADYAFSLYWFFRLILLFMASFEMGYLLTKRYRYALISAFVIVFAPAVQWWLSQALMIMLMSGQFAVVLYDRYLKSDSIRSRFIYLIGVFYFGMVYILTMYPATQVPLGYIFLGILIYLVIKNRDKKPFSKQRLISYLIVSLPFIGIIIRFFLKSKDALKTIMNTVYPGSSRPWIPLSWDFELYQFVNVFTALLKHPQFLNASEISQFFTFTPFVVLSMVFLLKNKEEYKGKLLLPVIILCSTGLLWLMSWLPYNSIINKLTLMSFTYPARITYAYGFGFTLLIISLLPLLENRSKNHSKKMIIGISGGVCFLTLCILTNSENVFNYFKTSSFGTIMMILTVILFSYMGYLLLQGGKQQTIRFSILLVVVSLGSTLMVNPLTQGTSSMFDKTTMAKIREIDSKDQGRWMVSGSPTISNLVTAQGVARTTGTYYYPDWTMMEIIDKDHKYINLWNQFAHIDMRLTDGPVEFSILDHEKSLKVDGTNRIIYIPIETARQLGVKYVFTMFPIPDKLLDNNDVTLLYQDKVDPWSIYKVNY